MSHVILRPSQAQIERRGVPIVRNTHKSTRTAINAWSSVQLKSLLGPNERIQIQTEEWIYEKLKEAVMPDAKANEALSLRSLENLNVSLGEFCEHYRKRNGDRLTPAALLVYLESINRWLNKYCLIKVNILHDKIFSHPVSGYKHVANSICSEQQAKGIRMRPYNTLTDLDVEKVLNHECTSPDTPDGHISRMIFLFGIFLGLRAESLRTLRWSMFHDELDHRNKPCLRYEGIIGSYKGDCKTQKGGLSAAKSLPTSIIIYDEELPYGLNLYQILLHHRKLCRETKNHIDVILMPNKSKNVRSTFLTGKVIGVNTLPKYWDQVVKRTGVRGAGQHKKPVLHSLRKTLINSLMRAGFTDAQITLRTGHKSVQSLQAYANIQGEAGYMQQKAIINIPEGSKGPPTKRKKLGHEGETLEEVLKSFSQGITNNGSMNISFNITINK